MSELFRCNGFKIIAAGRQSRKFLEDLSEPDWSKLNTGMDHLTKALLSGAPTVGRAEKVASSSGKLIEVKISRGGPGPRLRVLCVIDGRKVVCVRGVAKRQRRLPRQDIVLAEKAAADYFRRKRDGEGGEGGPRSPA